MVGVRLGYQNVGGGTDATHEYLERCARGDVVIAFVGECWVEMVCGKGTQSHPDFVCIGGFLKGARVAVHVRKDWAHLVSIVHIDLRVVVLELGGVLVGGVYGKCGHTVHTASQWLRSIRKVVDGRRWVLLGDWNAHHRSWSLEGKEDSVGRVLAEWVEGMGAEVKFGGGRLS